MSSPDSAPSAATLREAFRLLRPLLRAHPWHGVPIGPDAPATVTTYIEIVPSDTVKYEVDKATGVLRVDRPQRYSNVCPALYGFAPQTYCGEAVARLAASRSGRDVERGDGDPLDLCVVTEKAFSRGDVLLRAIPIGGLRLLDKGEADDKIVAVLEGDATYGALRDLSAMPAPLVERLRHYFLTYKTLPRPDGTFPPPTCEVVSVYGRAEAHEVIEAARADYQASYGAYAETLAVALRDEPPPPPPSFATVTRG
jgi:inorganic pyrophosphatase